nr:GFA family protein [uncultured Undibacterium sp.]
MNYHGSCHCGNIQFDVEGELQHATACNCSICQRKGTLLWFVDANQVKLLTPREKITTYTFNKHVIQHQFCPVCGVQTFGEGKDPSGNAVFAINIRCLEGIDPLAVPSDLYDGRAI